MTIYNPIELPDTWCDRLADRFWNAVNSMTQAKADKIMRTGLLVVAAAVCVAANL